MLIHYRPQFIEKILTDAAGRRFRVVFAVSFFDGEIRGRIVSAEEIKVFESKPLCLPSFCTSHVNCVEPVFSTDTEYISPYFSLFDFLITSQPTRAPARA